LQGLALGELTRQWPWPFRPLRPLRPARLLEAAAGAYQAEDGYLFMSIVIVFIMSSNVKQLTIFEDQPKTVKK